jgi:hypothetical protein
MFVSSNVTSCGKVKCSDIVVSKLDPLPDGRTKTVHDFGSTSVSAQNEVCKELENEESSQLHQVPYAKVVSRTIADERTDGRMMAAGSSMT